MGVLSEESAATLEAEIIRLTQTVSNLKKLLATAEKQLTALTEIKQNEAMK